MKSWLSVKSCQNFCNLQILQFLLLIVISAAFLYVAPNFWHYSPDGGVYIGTTLNILDSGNYWFNGHPNLHYYPGLSTLLLIPISIFGLNFLVLHLFCSAIVITVLWLARSYFNYEKYNIAGIAVPIVLACNTIFQHQIFTILSGGSFLIFIFSALLSWRKYEQEGSYTALTACIVFTALAPMVRFEGLFVIGAFALAFFINSLKTNHNKWLSIPQSAGIFLVAITPFALWTWRNYRLYTEDTFNMANAFFFGLKGLQLYAPNSHQAEWIEEPWMLGIYNTLFTAQEVFRSFVENAIPSLSLEADIAIFLIILVPGFLLWLRIASSMERILIISLAGFLIFKTMSAHNLYILSRYWLSVIPFITIIGTLGIYRYYSFLKNGISKKVFTFLATTLFASIAISGTISIVKKSSPDRINYYQNANTTLKDMGQYVQSITDKETVIATTDWGVLPLYTQRVSYQLLNDENHLLSVQRILKYQTELLVILDGNAAFPSYARKMTENLPLAFRLIKDFHPKNGSGPKGSIYKINLKWLEKTYEYR